MSRAFFTPYLAPLQAHWKALARREQTLALAAGGLVGLALVWSTAIAPALQTLRTAPARHAELDTQLQRMQSLQAEADQLKKAPHIRGGDAMRSLQNTLGQRLGSAAQIHRAGDRATVTLKNAPADALAAWLTQARATTQAVPVEARLVQSPKAVPIQPPRPGTPPGASQPSPFEPSLPHWDGTVVLVLPPA